MSKFFLFLGKSDMRGILAIIGTLGSFSLLGLMQVHPIPPGNKDAVTLAVGIVLGGSLSNVFSYYFGSSKNDSDSKKAE